MAGAEDRQTTPTSPGVATRLGHTQAAVATSAATGRRLSTRGTPTKSTPTKSTPTKQRKGASAANSDTAPTKAPAATTPAAQDKAGTSQRAADAGKRTPVLIKLKDGSETSVDPGWQKIWRFSSDWLLDAQHHATVDPSWCASLSSPPDEKTIVPTVGNAALFTMKGWLPELGTAQPDEWSLQFHDLLPMEFAKVIEPAVARHSMANEHIVQCLRTALKPFKDDIVLARRKTCIEEGRLQTLIDKIAEASDNLLQQFAANKGLAAALKTQAEQYTPEQLQAAGADRPEITAAQLVLEALKFATDRELCMQKFAVKQASTLQCAHPLTLMAEALATAHHVPAETLKKATTGADYIEALMEYQEHLYDKGGTDTVRADGIVLGLQTLVLDGPGILIDAIQEVTNKLTEASVADQVRLRFGQQLPTSSKPANQPDKPEQPAPDKPEQPAPEKPEQPAADQTDSDSGGDDNSGTKTTQPAKSKKSRGWRTRKPAQTKEPAGDATAPATGAPATTSATRRTPLKPALKRPRVSFNLPESAAPTPAARAPAPAQQWHNQQVQYVPMNMPYQPYQPYQPYCSG